MQTSRLPHAAALLVFTAVVWGAMFAVAKSALTALDAFWVSALRYIPAALIMLAILWMFEGRRALLPGGAAMKLGLSARWVSPASASSVFWALRARAPSMPRSSCR